MDSHFKRKQASSQKMHRNMITCYLLKFSIYAEKLTHNIALISLWTTRIRFQNICMSETHDRREKVEFLVVNRYINGLSKLNYYKGLLYGGNLFLSMICISPVKKSWEQLLTHWCQYKMVAISQTTFSNAFFRMKMYKFWLWFHLNLFPRVQLTISQHWFR